MILSKKQYYKRRWFLSILFLLSGFWLIYKANGMFGYHKNIDELKSGNTIPSKISVEKIESTDNKFLALYIDNEKIASVIEQSELDKLIELTKKKELAITNSPVKGNELSSISFEYKYWNDKLFELKINDYTIIEFKKESKILLM